jgi:hypothetical protein
MYYFCRSLLMYCMSVWYRKWDDLDGFLQRIDTSSPSTTVSGSGSSSNDSSISNSDHDKKRIQRLVSVLPEDKFQVPAHSPPQSPSLTCALNLMTLSHLAIAPNLYIPSTLNPLSLSVPYLPSPSSVHSPFPYLSTPSLYAFISEGLCRTSDAVLGEKGPWGLPSTPLGCAETGERASNTE